MKATHIIAVFFLITVFFTGSSLAQNVPVYYTLEASNKINHVTMSPPTAMKRFRSVNVTQAGGVPEDFQMIFPKEFHGKFQTTGGVTTPDAYTPGVDPVVFSSSANDEFAQPCNAPLGGSLGVRPCKEIRIRLTAAAENQAGGFTYTVKMGAYTLDPRLRGK